jgi:Lrp/AsnC family transcriptional regulator, leucine-responsive regulatory protein
MQADTEDHQEDPGEIDDDWNLEKIRGFTATLDPHVLGLFVGACIRVRPAMGDLPRVASLLSDIRRSSNATALRAKILSWPRSSFSAPRIANGLSTYAQANTSIIQPAPVTRGARKYRYAGSIWP